jgi:hypothetical protein
VKQLFLCLFIKFQESQELLESRENLVFGFAQVHGCIELEKITFYDPLALRET